MQYGCNTDPNNLERGCCAHLTKQYENVVRLWDVYMGNLVTRVKIYKGGKPTGKYWAWTTSPSTYAFTVVS